MTSGSVYALVAISFNILFRPTSVFNFAQGELLMLGAMIGASLLLARVSWPLALPAVMLAVGLLALLEEQIAVAPVVRRSSSSHAWIISTLAFSLVITNAVVKIWGPDPIRVKPPYPLSTSAIEIFGVTTSTYQLALIVVTPVLLFGLEQIYRSRLGRIVTAVAEDREAAMLRGINPDRVSQWSFFLGGAFAALVGMLAAPRFYASTDLGPLLLLRGFEAAAIGGIGSNRGALLAGYLLGVAEAVSAYLLSPGYQKVASFALLLVVLLVRPQGLLGKVADRHV
jgi:branched-chain amino acid transport system permease protein